MPPVHHIHTHSSSGRRRLETNAEEPRRDLLQIIRLRWNWQNRIPARSRTWTFPHCSPPLTAALSPHRYNLSIPNFVRSLINTKYTYTITQSKDILRVMSIISHGWARMKARSVKPTRVLQPKHTVERADYPHAAEPDYPQPLQRHRSRRIRRST